MKKVMCLLAIMFMIANTSAQTRVIAHRGFWKPRDQHRIALHLC